MLHFLVHEGHKHRVSGLDVLDFIVMPAVIRAPLLGSTKCGVKVDEIEHHGLERRDIFLHIVLIFCRALPHLDAVQSSHLKQACLRQCVVVHLEAVGIARGQVHIHLHVGGTGSRGYLGKGLVDDQPVGRIFYVVVVGVVVGLAPAHVVGLLLGRALGIVLHAEAGNLLRHLVYLPHFALEFDRIAGRAEHRAQQISRHLVLLVVVVEAYAERCFQRVEHFLYARIGKVVAVGYHLADIGRYLHFAQLGFNINALQVVLAHFDRFPYAAVVYLVLELLHLLDLRLVDTELTATAARSKPFIDVLKAVE